MGCNVRWGFLKGGKRVEKAYLLLAIGLFNHVNHGEEVTRLESEPDLTCG
jgi:hypothetical protein